jgi:outer membrane autotransporter protein
LHRYAAALLSFLAGVLLFQSAQAQTLVDAGAGQSLPGPTPGTYTQMGDPPPTGPATQGSILLAHDGGTITGQAGTLTLNVTAGGTKEVIALNAVGTSTSPSGTTTPSQILMTAGRTVIIMPFAIATLPSSPFPNIRGAWAQSGGQLTLTNGSSPGTGENTLVDMQLGSGLVSAEKGQRRGVEAANPGAILSATNTTILMNSRNSIGAFAFGPLAQLFLTNCIVTQTNSNGLGWGIVAEDDTDNPQRPPTILIAKNTMISVTGDGNDVVAAYFRGPTTTIDHSTVTASGSNNNPLVAWFGGVVNVLNGTTVTSTGSHAALVDTGSVLNVDGSTISGDLNGIDIFDENHNRGRDLVTLTGKSTLTNLTGAAFRVEAADVDIFVTNSTVDSGVGATQHILLDVTHTVPSLRAVSPVSVTAAVTQPAQVADHPSDVVLTANNSMLNGDIRVDATSTANVFLETSSTLNGAVNENSLTGATGINPNELIPPTVIPPQSVNLNIDSTSTWNMRASSTLNTLSVNPQAHINFADPPTGAFKTLLVNNLLGTGGIFGMNVDLGLIKGDLIEILTKSEGEHLLTFVNRNQGSDLPVNTALLVVRTPDGGAGFTGETDGGTFKYFVIHGDGSPVTPIKNDWYLVRGDEIKPPQVTPPPPTNPKPTPPEFVPGDVLPLPPEVPTAPLSPADDLTNTANAAIGTYSSNIPLFYADMQTLVERMGELRLGIEAAPAPVPPPTTKEVGKGVVESKQIVAPPPPRSEWGVWTRGFGNGMRINNNVSRPFDQNVGGFQIGADKRFGSLWSGDVYLGVFGSYFYASRDFRDGGDGSTNAFSLGGYATWIHPQGWYADAVVKYTQMWNYFNTPTQGEIVSHSTGDYNIPTVGGSLEVGKRFDFANHCFFIEPQAQLAGVWENGMDYTASNGLRVHGDDQTSLQGRLGGRLGMHFDLSQGRAIEPYAKAEVIEEFLTGNTVRTDTTNFDSHLSGTVGRFGGGLAAKLSQSVYIYGEYDYATGDHIQAPWSVSAGLRWQW